MVPSKSIDEIQRLVSESKTEEALRLLGPLVTDSPSHQNWQALSARFHQANRDRHAGVIGYGEASKEIANVNRGLSELLRALAEQSGISQRPLAVFLTSIRQPPLPPHLVIGRENDLRAIGRKFAEGDHLLLLNGMGGVGKSTLAGCYMALNPDGYRHIAWVYYNSGFAADCAHQLNDYKALGITTEDYDGLGEPGTVQLFHQLLQYMARLDGPNLLIVDNLNTLDHAEDAATNARLLPPGWKVLLTAREHNHSFPHHNVGVLKPDEARELFLRHCPLGVGSPQSAVGSQPEKTGNGGNNHPPTTANQGPPANVPSAQDSPATSALTPSSRRGQGEVRPINDPLTDLLTHVGHHTLVVEFLAKTTKAQGWTPAKMLDRLKKQGLTRLDTRVEVATAHSNQQRIRMADYIAVLFDINLDQLGTAERWLLANLSVLPAFAHAFSVLVEMFAKKAGMDEDSLYPLLNGLCNKGYLENLPARRPAHLKLEGEAAVEEGFYMHPVMQEVVREKEQPGMEVLGGTVQYFIYKYYDGDGAKNPVLAFAWLPYGEAIAAHLPEEEDAATLMNNLSTLYDAQGDYPSALRWQQQATDIWEKVLGAEHPDLASSYNNLCTLYYAQGDYPSALTWQQQAIAIREKVLGAEHPDLASSYNNLSLIYKAQGDYPSALTWQQKATDIWEKVLGAEHPSLATSYNNLSQIYLAQGDYPSALRWQQQAIAIREKVLGENHPDMAQSLHNLAAIYDSIDEPQKALPYSQRAVGIWQRCFPQGHPHLDAALWWLEHIQGRAGG